MSTTQMKNLESTIEKLERRIKKIKENPDPTKLKSNLMLYELERDNAIGELEDMKAGKPFARGSPGLLLRAMGFSSGGGGNADRTAQGEGSTRYLDLLRDGGWPELACDRTVVSILLTTEADCAKPNFVSVCNQACEFTAYNAHAMAQMVKVPYFVVDIGNDVDDENLRYVTDQLGEMIEYIEAKVPGTRYDEAKLIELQHYDRQMSDVLRETYEFRKRRPSPVNPRDAQREQGPMGGHRFPQRCLEYMKAQRDELFERAEKGIGVMAEERLRLMWTTVGINHDESIYKWLEEQGVALFYVWGMFAHNLGLRGGYYGDLWNGRKLTPLEEETRAEFYNSWNGRGQRLIDDWGFVAREQAVDGVVYVLQPGCLQTLNLRKPFADAMEKAGLPTLSMEIRGIFKEGYSQKDVKAKLSNFIEICLANKQAKGGAASS